MNSQHPNHTPIKTITREGGLHLPSLLPTGKSMTEDSVIGRLFAHWQDLALFSTISLVFGFIKVIINPEPVGLIKSGIAIFISVFIGTLAGAICLQSGWGDYTAISVTSFASLIARDIVMAIIRNGSYIGDWIKTAVENLINKYTKKKD
jgi:hypothetical protein